MKTAWFLTHRIREAMKDGELSPMGGVGTPVEADETFTGRKEGFGVKQGYGHKNAVLTLVERKGRARSFHVEGVKKADLAPILRAHIKREAHLMTDEGAQYTSVEFANHGKVDHSREEWAYFDRKTGQTIAVNAAEGYFSIFKRGMTGIYPILQRAPPSPLSRRVRFPLFLPGSRPAMMTRPALSMRCLASRESGLPMKRLRTLRAPIAGIGKPNEEIQAAASA
jgi:hypothetical protein